MTKGNGIVPLKKELRIQVRQFAELRSDVGQAAKLLLKKGLWFWDRAHSGAYEQTNAFRKARRPKPKRCFYNAQLYVLHHQDESRYFEGYAICKRLAFHHAWVVMPDGNVIDFTLEAAHDEKSADAMTLCVYLGIESTRTEISEAITKQGISAPFLNG
ncbi:MAG: hypothetical protein FJ303_21065 [Planctomycetes bacterium]|nr:hypothetical protein [Planctomycetota bacterium]